MAKITMKGFFEAIGKDEVFGEKGTRVQKVIFMVPGFVDQFQEKKGKDERWELAVMGDKIDELDLNKKISDSRKAEVICFVNSKVWYKTDDTTQDHPQYSAYVILHEVKHIV